MYSYMAYNVTPAQLLKAMKGEAEARKYYKLLISMAPIEKEADIIEHFYEDETKHLSKFRINKEAEFFGEGQQEVRKLLEGKS